MLEFETPFVTEVEGMSSDFLSTEFAISEFLMAEPEQGPWSEQLLDESFDTTAMITPGRHVVAHHPVLRRHHGTSPDLLVKWSAMPATTATVDVVVHLHGYSGRGHAMRLKDKEPVSGLDLHDPTNAARIGRSTPTLLLLPRGNFFGGRYGNGYNFPELVKPGAIASLVNDALAVLRIHAGITTSAGRLILTGHSGGGAPVNAILRHTDPDEVHIFDGTYGDQSHVIAWAARRIGRSDTESALRVLYRPGSGTQRHALRVRDELAPIIARSGDPARAQRRFRIESTRTEHNDIPRKYGWLLLRDAAADLPDASQPHPSARHETDSEYDREGYDASESFAGAQEWHENVNSGSSGEAFSEEAATGEGPFVTLPRSESQFGSEFGSEATLEAQTEALASAWDETGSAEAEWAQLEAEQTEWGSFEAESGTGELEALESGQEWSRLQESEGNGESELEAEGLETEGLLASDPAAEGFDGEVHWELSEGATNDRAAGVVRRGRFQRCSGKAQVGAVALGRQWTRLTGRKAGIYNCRSTVFGTPSLHGEGRAVDCYSNALKPDQKAQSEAYAAWLITNAVELQVAVVIWNRRIWSWAYRAKGWRPYRGNPHTDHVHVELSWQGALHPSPLLGGPVPGLAGSPAPGPAPAPAPPRPAPAAHGLTPAQFVQSYLIYAVASQATTGVPALVTLGQAALESGWGKRAAGNNFFGIKARASDPPATRQLWRTREVLPRPDATGFPEILSVTPRPDGRYDYVVRDWFRVFGSPAEAFIGHGAFLRKNKRYAKAFDHMDDPYAFARQVAAAGYATAPNYADVLSSVMRTIEKHGGPRTTHQESESQEEVSATPCWGCSR